MRSVHDVFHINFRRIYSCPNLNYVFHHVMTA
jgi:hypothetical protein